MNRRGFIAAILAAPLAAVGSFAGNHTVTEAEYIAFLKATKMGPYKIGTGMWTNLFPEASWTYVEFGDGGRIVRKEHYGKLPFVSMGNFAGVEL